ncbi:hypothetical protein [Caldanaerobacter subterraneus]|nr:hypothetical protein [Caldanaerobacter subterraneus]TCO64224.1 hypothetical protein EV203_11266 [Caldanaerobacter subterraneus]
MKKLLFVFLLILVLSVSLVNIGFAASTQNYIRHYAWSSDWGTKIFAFYVSYSASNYTSYPLKYISDHYVAAFNPLPNSPEIGNGNCYLIGVDVVDASSGTLLGSLDSSQFINNPNGSIWNPGTLIYFDLYSPYRISYYSTSPKTVNAIAKTLFQLDPSWIPNNWTDYTTLTFNF